MNRKKSLGITALLAVLVFVLMFTTCDGLGGDNQEECVVIFSNQSAASFRIICNGSDPNPVILPSIKSASAEANEVIVRGKGKVTINSITITAPTLPGDTAWDYIDISGDAVPAGKGKGDGLDLKAGTIIFKNGTGQSLLGFKVDVIPQDE